MPTGFQLPDAGTPWLDKRTGLVAMPWYRYLVNLFTNVSSVASGGTATEVFHGGGTGFSKVQLAADVAGTLGLANFAQGTQGQVLIGQSPAASAYRTVTGVVRMVSTGEVTFITSAVVNTVQTVGSWTPTDASGASPLTLSNVSASYTVIGNVVFAYATLTYPGNNSNSAASIGGLPVTSANANYAQVPAICETNTAITGGLIYKITKNTRAGLLKGASPTATVSNVHLSGASVTFIATYPAS